MKTLNRRDFMLVTAGSVALAACGKAEKPAPAGRSARAKTTDEPTSFILPEGKTRDEIFAHLDRRVDLYMGACHHCAQATFVVLQEEFGLDNGAILKALTPVPGIGERGETCGAVTASLMALGLIFGRDRLDDWEGYRKSLIPARKFCEAFKEEFGSTMCGDIQEDAFGKRFDLLDEVDLAEFQASGATEKCGAVVKKAVRMAAEVILDGTLET